MNDEQFFLANAYLDGELTDEERAIAEADPEVMTAVEELRAVQDLVRDVEPPSTTARDSAIAAAMTQFGTVAPPATVRTADERRTPAPVPFRPRPSYGRYLAVAAGVLGVGLLGVAIATVDLGSRDDSTGDDAALEPVAEERSADAGVFSADEPAAEMVTVVPAEEPAEEPAMDVSEEPASEPAGDAAEEPAEEPASEEPASEEAPASGEPPVLEPGQVLTTPEEVGAFGTELFERELDGTLPPTPNHACPIDGVLGRAEFLADGATTWILVAIEEPAGLVLGFDEETCELLVEGPLYLP